MTKMIPENNEGLKKETAIRFCLIAIITTLVMPCAFAAEVPQIPLANASFDGSWINSIPSKSSVGLVYGSFVAGAPIAPSWSSYHNYADLVALLRQLNATYPNLVEIHSIGRTWQNREIYCIKITNKYSNSSNKKQILVLAEHHGREVITQEAALYFTLHILSSYADDPDIRELLDSKEIYVIPCLNPDGMEVALTYNPFQRKNMHPIDDDGDGFMDEDIIKDIDANGRLDCYEQDLNIGTPGHAIWTMYDIAYEGNATRGDGAYQNFVSDNPGGIDLNRNYDFHFNDTFEMSSNSTNPRVEDYKGPAPFSEPETRAIKDLVESNNFIFAISLHSGTATLLRPWAYTTDTSSLGADHSLFNLFGIAFGEVGRYPYSTGPGNIGYNSSGDFCDWMYGIKGIPAMTCEIYGNPSAYQYQVITPDQSKFVWWGVWNYFNPLSQRIEQICTQSLSLLLQVSAINHYSSFRLTSPYQKSIVFDDDSSCLNLTWKSDRDTDVGVSSFDFVQDRRLSRYSIEPASHILSALTSRSCYDVNVSICYNRTELSTIGIDESDLRLFTWDEPSSTWADTNSLRSRIDNQTGMLSTTAAVLIANTPYIFVLGAYLKQSNVASVIFVLAGTVATAAAAFLIYRHGKARKKGVPRSTAARASKVA